MLINCCHMSTLPPLAPAPTNRTLRCAATTHAIAPPSPYTSPYTCPCAPPIYTHPPALHHTPRSLQCFLLVAILLAFFILTSSTPIVQLGLYDRYLKQHRLYFLIAAASLACFLGVGAYGIVSGGARFAGLAAEVLI